MLEEHDVSNVDEDSIYVSYDHTSVVEQFEKKLDDAYRELAESVRGEIELRLANNKLNADIVFLRGWVCQLLVEHGHCESHDAAVEEVLCEQKKLRT